MNNKVIIFIVLFVLILLALALNYQKITNLYNDFQVRRMIYPASSTQTKYPGVGQITTKFEEKLLVIPKGEGRPFYTTVDKESDYNQSNYIVYDIPTQDQLLYTVGTFQRWEDIAGSQDKYIIIKNPVTNLLEKYRLNFEISDLFGENPTFLAVENISQQTDSNKTNLIEKPNTSKLIDLTFSVVKPLLKNGDAVVLLPAFNPSDLSKKDTNNNYLASWLILRRLGGKQSIKL